MKRVGILYHPKIAAAGVLAEDLATFLRSLEVPSWLCSAWEEDEARACLADTELILSIGGDGTILRAARAVVHTAVPIVGVNMGTLGFMTELRADEAQEKIRAFLAGQGWLDERAMLQVELLRGGRAVAEPWHALNDAVVGRGAVCRVVRIDAAIDGALLTTYKADGVIVATATGSTGYSLAVGGPILYPQARDILLNSVSPHPVHINPLLLPPTATIELKVHTDHQAVFSIDGQVDINLESGDVVRVRLSPHVTRFLRARPPTFFYTSLMQKLGRK